MSAAIIGHVRKIALHHVEVDDDCGSFEIGEMRHRISRMNRISEF